MTASSGLRHHYRSELEALDVDLAGMTDQVRVAIRQATEALLSPSGRLAEKVVAADADLDARRREVEARCVELLTRQAPVAGELRLVLAAMRIAADLERMGDLAVHVAKIARLRAPERAVPAALVPNFAEMGRLAESLAAAAGTVLRERDATAALRFDEHDEEMDDLRASQFRIIMGRNWAYGVEAAVDVALLGRYYERFGDHAVTLAGRVVYLVTGAEPTAWHGPHTM